MVELNIFKRLGRDSLEILEQVKERKLLTESFVYTMSEYSVRVLPILMYGDSEYVLRLKELIPLKFRDEFQLCMSQLLNKQNLAYAISGGFFLGTDLTTEKFLQTLINNIRESLDVMFPGWTEKYGYTPASV